MDDTPEREHTYDNEQEQRAYEEHVGQEEDAPPVDGPAAEGEVEDAEDEAVGGG